VNPLFPVCDHFQRNEFKPAEFAHWPQILTFLHTGITNAGSEGTNRVIKTVARHAYGFRNPANQRLRTRCATTRKTRGHLDPANFVEPRCHDPEP